MLETAVVAFTTFFATIGPVDIAIIYAVMTHDSSAEAKKAMAIRGCMIASFILTGFLLAGETLLFALGISLAALKVSGGILLLLIAIDMVFDVHRAYHPPPMMKTRKRLKKKISLCFHWPPL